VNNLKFGLQLELDGDQVVVRGVDNARGSVEGLTGAVDENTESTKKQAAQNKILSQTLSGVSTAAKATAGIVTALVGSVAALTITSANNAREIQNLSRVANTGAEDFQRMTFGAKIFGVEQEKVADILKDVSDKVGDFLTTGAGPMVDFFDTVAPRVGVTAEQFRNLSGKDALQLYIDSLERANLSQSEMTFFMEAIASDATLLLPLMRDNGAEMSRLANEADRLGVVLSQVEIDQLNDIKTEISQFQATVQGLSNDLVIALLPSMQEFSELVNDPKTVDQLKAIAGAIGTVAVFAVEAATGISSFVQGLAEAAAARIHGPAFDDLERINERIAELRENIAHFGSLDPSDLNPIEAEWLAGWKTELNGLIELQKMETSARLESVLIQTDQRELQADLADGASDEAEARGKTGQALIEEKEAREEALKAAEKLAEQQQDLIDTLFPLDAAERQHAENLELLEGWYAKNTDKTAEYIAAKAILEEQLNALQNPLQATINGIQQETIWLQKELAATLNGESALKSFNRTKAIETQLRRHNVEAGSDEEKMLRDEIAARYDAQQAIDDYKDSIEDSNEAAKEAQRIQEQFITEIVGSFIDGTGDMGDAWSDMLDRLKRELINSGIAALFGFESASTPLLSGLQQLFSGGNGGGSGLGGAGVDLSSIFSLEGIANLGPGSIGAVASFLMEGAADLSASAGLYGLSDGISNYWGGLAETGSNIGGAVGLNDLSTNANVGVGILANAIAGYAGQWTGEKLGQELFNKQAESNYGASSLALIGSYLGGPLGTFAGATIGGMLDAAFGGDGYKRQAVGATVQPWETAHQNTGYYTTGASGLNYVGLTEGGQNAETANAIANALAATDSALTFLAQLQGADAVGALNGQALLNNNDTEWGQAFWGALDGENLDLAEFENALAAKIEKATGTALNIADIRPLIQDGEALGDTIYRIGGQLPVVNAALDALGIDALEFTTAGLAAADSLVQAAGGLDNLVSLTDFYYSNVYTEQEKAQLQLDQYTQTLNDFNNTNGTAITSLDDLRAYVDSLTESQDFNSEATQAAYIAALQLTPTLVAQKQAMDLLAPAVEEVTDTVTDAVEELLSAGQINTLTDISRTIFDDYENREDSIKDLQDELADIDAEIADLTSNASDGFETVADTIDGVTNSVQSLSTSSSELRSQADAIRNTIASLSLGASTYLNNTEQLNFAEQQFEEAKKIYESTNDSSGLNSAASAYAAELAQYHSGNATGRAKFDAMLEYMQSVGVELEGQASAAERAEAIARDSQASLENIDSTQNQLLTDINNNDRLDALYQQRQTIAAELAQLTATESKGILETKLQALVDSTPAIDSLPGLLETLPQDIADALGGVLAISPEEYGSNSDLVNQLFNTVLNRDPTSTETDYWQTYLDNAGTGQTVSDFFDQFGNGSYQDAVTEGDILEQFNDVFDNISPVITDFFDSVLGRAPALEGAEFWQGVLDTEGLNKTIEEMYATLSREGINPLVSQDEFLNSFDTGTPFVSHDQTANIHRGEIIIDPQSSDVLRKYGISISGNNNAEIVAKLDTLISRVESLENTTGTGTGMLLTQGREHITATQEAPAEIARQLNPVSTTPGAKK